ncbi:MAG: hypothetical protein WCI05_00065 [Myxococcales bacterium]
MSRWCWAFLGLVACVGCGRSRGEASDAMAVDLEMMAFLSAARAFHHEANVYEATGDVPGAIGALERLVRFPRPHPEAQVVEIDEVMADVRARLAELRLQSRDLAGASADIEAGLAHAPHRTYFRGLLLQVDGTIEERRFYLLADAGLRDEAAKAKARALERSEEAVSIHEEVIRRSLGMDGGEGR